MGDPFADLTPTQIAAIEALLSSKSMREAAAKVGVSYQTLSTWQNT